MENVIKILPIIVVVLVVFLIREGLSFYRYVKYCRLHEAAKTGKIDKVRRLLEAGHPENAVDPSFGLTPLHFAVRNGHVEVARLLIENGADLTQPSTQGITPLDWTSRYLAPRQRAAVLVLPPVAPTPMMDSPWLQEPLRRAMRSSHFGSVV